MSVSLLVTSRSLVHNKISSWTSSSPASAVPSTNRLQIPTGGLIAAYLLNADANDFVGGHHGIIHGAVPTSNRFTNGSSAYAFNGTNAYIEIPDHPAFSVATTGQLSISAWIRPGTLTFQNTEGNGYVSWMGKGDTYDINGNQEWACRMYNWLLPGRDGAQLGEGSVTKAVALITGEKHLNIRDPRGRPVDRTTTVHAPTTLRCACAKARHPKTLPAK
jgi:hypothetical protein